jgi:uncharacterized protein DUF2726
MSELLFAAAAVVLVSALVIYLASFPRLRRPSRPFVLPSDATLTSAPLLSESEVLLYNVIRLAVQDHYLVLAQVPLWSFVSVEAMGDARRQLLNEMALKRVDFVLVHPGSRQVEQVLQVEDGSPASRRAERERVIELVIGAAGIKLVKLRAQKLYRVPDLISLFGLVEEE